MASTPGYCSTLISNTAKLTTAGTDRNTPTNTGVIFDPGTSGGLCERITVAPVAAPVASCISIFKLIGGAYSFLFDIPVAAQNLVTGQAFSTTELSAANFPTRFPINCKAGQTLVAMVQNAQTGIQVTGEGGGL